MFIPRMGSTRIDAQQISLKRITEYSVKKNFFFFCEKLISLFLQGIKEIGELNPSPNVCGGSDFMQE